MMREARAAIEPLASEHASAEEEVGVSIAISLKRIADALEKLAENPRPTPSVFEAVFGPVR